MLITELFKFGVMSLSVSSCTTEIHGHRPLLSRRRSSVCVRERSELKISWMWIFFFFVLVHVSWFPSLMLCSDSPNRTCEQKRVEQRRVIHWHWNGILKECVLNVDSRRLSWSLEDVSVLLLSLLYPRRFLYRWGRWTNRCGIRPRNKADRQR